MTPALQAYMNRRKRNQPRNVAGQDSNYYPSSYSNVAEEITPETPQGRYQPFTGSEANRGTFGTPSGFAELDPSYQEIRDFHNKQVKAKPSVSKSRTGRSVEQANREAQAPVILSNTGYQPSGSLKQRMRNQVGDKVSRRVPTKPTASRGSGRSIEQANAEAQDPLHEFLLDQGILNSQGKAQDSLKQRMRNQTPEFQGETANRNARANAKSKSRIPTKAVQPKPQAPQTLSNPLSGTKFNKYVGESSDVSNPLSGTRFSPSQPEQEESSYWDDFVNFFSSDDEGMLSDKDKKRKKKKISGQVAWGKGR